MEASYSSIAATINLFSTSFQLSARTYGTLITIFGVLTLCPDTLLLRKVEGTDDWTVMFWRGVFFGSFMLLFQSCHHWGVIKTIQNFKNLGYLGLFAGVVQGVSMVLFTLGVMYTAAANVLVINATNPIFSSILSYFILKEKIPLKTLVVIVICFGAILVVFSTEMGGASTAESTWGNLSALGAAVTLGLYFVLIRLASINNHDIDMLGCNVISGVITALAGVIFGSGLKDVSATSYGFLVAQGLCLAISFGCLTIGPAYISAPEVSLYTLIETILAPIYVFLAGFEEPPQNTIYGGIMIAVALIGHR
jgi:drug/metabolite transporter (DMT)-like permease